jgi:hypothetical protein
MSIDTVTLKRVYLPIIGHVYICFPPAIQSPSKKNKIYDHASYDSSYRGCPIRMASNSSFKPPLYIRKKYVIASKSLEELRTDSKYVQRTKKIKGAAF